MGADEDLAAANANAKAKEAEEALKKAEAEAEKWKGLSRKHEERAKENTSAADELKKLQESKQTEEEKRDADRKAAADKVAALEKRADEADARALRAEVAAAKGLSAAQAKRLSGITKEELEADADDLLESFKPADTDGEPGKGKKGGTTAPASRPKERLSGGGDPEEEPEVETSKVLDSIPRL